MLAGSPFTVEVVDPGTVIAQGEGLVSAQANHQAVFTVSSDNESSFNVGDCRITIYGMYTASQKKQDTVLVLINSRNINRFSQFLLLDSAQNLLQNDHYIFHHILRFNSTLAPELANHYGFTR